MGEDRSKAKPTNSLRARGPRGRRLRESKKGVAHRALQDLRDVQRPHEAPSGALGGQVLLVRRMRQGLSKSRRLHDAPSGAHRRTTLLVRNVAQSGRKICLLTVIMNSEKLAPPPRSAPGIPAGMRILASCVMRHASCVMPPLGVRAPPNFPIPFDFGN